MGTNITEIQTPKQLPCNNLKEEIIKKIVCGESHVAIITGIITLKNKIE